MNKSSITIAVTGLNAIDSPGPGVGVIRGLKEASSFDARIIGLAYETLEPGIYMENLTDATYIIPYPSEGTDALLDRLAYIHSKENINVIIPNFDAELYSFMKLEPVLKSMGINMFLPTFDQFEERHKVNLSEFGEKYDIPVPTSKAVNSIKDITDYMKDKEYPVMVKGKWYDAYVAQNADQAGSYFYKISAKWGLPVVMQKFIQGTEYNVIGLGDGNGNLLSAVPMRKQFITDKGKAWAGISIEDKKLIAMTEKFVRSTKWRGAFELELMKNGDNIYYLMEINPRIPAWVYLAVGVGQNIPEGLANLAMGKTVEPFQSYDVGKLFIRYSYDMIVDRSQFEKISVTGELTV